MEVKTFLLDRLSVFLKDTRVLFLPKEHSEILEDLSRCQQNYKMQFNVQEIGIFEKIIEQLRPSGPEEEKELEDVYRFVIDNSQDIAGTGGGPKGGLSTLDTSSLRSGITTRDSKGRLVQRGVHRDIPPRAFNGNEAATMNKRKLEGSVS